MTWADGVCVDSIYASRVKSVSGFFDIKPRAQCALAFRLSGDVEFYVDDEVIKSKPGDVFYMPSDTGYKALYSDGEIIVLHFYVRDNPGKAKNFTCNSSEEIYRLFLRAELLGKEKKPGYKYYIASVFYEIMGLLNGDAMEKEQPDFFRSAVSEMNKYFSDSSLCLSDVCRTHGISETYFRQLFKLYYGKTPIEYITSLRLEYAKDLLCFGHTVEQAATMSGFSDAKYFSRVVKKHYGCTPSELKGTRLKT